jgi:hypothetical protein
MREIAISDRTQRLLRYELERESAMNNRRQRWSCKSPETARRQS